jgi:uncharacterized RDD family membrane protein YckC
MVRGEDGQEYGPVALDELRQWVRENRAGLGTEVRLDEAGASWHPWQNYPELVALLAEAQATCSVPGQPGLVIAPVGRRIAAFVLDLALIVLLYLPIIVPVALIYMPDFCVEYAVAASRPPFSSPVVTLYQELVINMIFNLVLTLYVTGFHSAHGQTPAKALLRLRVVDQSGGKPSVTKSFLRALALIFSMNLFFLPLACAFFNPQRRTLHDFVAGTYVVEA